MQELFNPFSLDGKNILVTGASSGIGRAIAISCSKMGARIILNGRNLSRLEEALSNLFGDGHCAVVADLCDEDSVADLVAKLPKLDGIVHCAGVANRVPCKSIAKDNIAEIMSANMEAPILLQAKILQNKKLNKSSSIVFIASRAAEFPSVGNAIYSASKGALISYSKCLALELASRLIRVNCICPGMVWTDLIENVLDHESLLLSEAKYPLKRFGKVEDIAYLVIYLLSDASSWMTGECLNISGGGEGVLM